MNSSTHTPKDTGEGEVVAPKSHTSVNLWNGLAQKNVGISLHTHILRNRTKHPNAVLYVYMTCVEIQLII